MRLTVCELPDEAERREAAWEELSRHLRASPTNLLVLPEVADHDAMPARERLVLPFPRERRETSLSPRTCRPGDSSRRTPSC